MLAAPLHACRPSQHLIFALVELSVHSKGEELRQRALIISSLLAHNPALSLERCASAGRAGHFVPRLGARQLVLLWLDLTRRTPLAGCRCAPYCRNADEDTPANAAVKAGAPLPVLQALVPPARPDLWSAASGRPKPRTPLKVRGNAARMHGRPRAGAVERVARACLLEAAGRGLPLSSVPALSFNLARNGPSSPSFPGRSWPRSCTGSTRARWAGGSRAGVWVGAQRHHASPAAASCVVQQPQLMPPTRCPEPAAHLRLAPALPRARRYRARAATRRWSHTWSELRRSTGGAGRPQGPPASAAWRAQQAGRFPRPPDSVHPPHPGREKAEAERRRQSEQLRDAVHAVRDALAADDVSALAAALPAVADQQFKVRRTAAPPPCERLPALAAWTSVLADARATAACLQDVRDKVLRLGGLAAWFEATALQARSLDALHAVEKLGRRAPCSA